MFFCILFNYTILRDTKDVLMITAHKSGAEVIPFIKTYCNLPAAIVSVVLYFAVGFDSKNHLSCARQSCHYNSSFLLFARVSRVFTLPCVTEWS
jgi:ATP/ADP translocase